MDIKEICKEDIIAVGNDSSFEEDIGEINDIFQKKSPKDFNLHLENEKNSSNDKIENIFENKYFEEAEMDEIYNVLNEINQAVTIDVNSTTKKDYYRSNSMDEPKINVIKENHSKECKEILSILRKPSSNKNVRNLKMYDTPFKPLLKPKKISLVGKIICGFPADDINTQCSSKDNNNSNNDNNLLIEGH
jgi:hypothetical protein